jgi:antitoxin component YwqK of YwqJK toxin-antitoxin module
VQWYENGKISSESEWKEGLLIDAVGWNLSGEKGWEVVGGNGLLTLWHENGQKRLEGNMKNSKKEGLWIGWYEKGQKKKEENFKDGKLDGLRRQWDEDNHLTGERTYKNGELISEKDF